jgi:hypothetical protein
MVPSLAACRRARASHGIAGQRKQCCGPNSRSPYATRQMRALRRWATRNTAPASAPLRLAKPGYCGCLRRTAVPVVSGPSGVGADVVANTPACDTGNGCALSTAWVGAPAAGTWTGSLTGAYGPRAADETCSAGVAGSEADSCKSVGPSARVDEDSFTRLSVVGKVTSDRLRGFHRCA